MNRPLTFFRRLKRCVIIAVAIWTSISTRSTQASVDFSRDILPLLKERCVECHGPETAEAALRLDTMTDALRGGDSGERVIDPGKSGQSYLIARLTSDDPDKRMPPDGDALTSDQVNLLRRWIDEKAAWQSAREELDAQQITHWSFQPLRRPGVPETSDTATPVDAFILRRLEKAGLTMSSSAARRRLIRRLYLIMTGLPPTPDRIHEFVDDGRTDAWDELVRDVLDSPHYGERMATFWLDLVRFGETHGFETNRERPNAWHYRDWVINAFNDDTPYDRFVRQQIAGDALDEDIATGFLVAGPYDLVKGRDPELRLMQRQDELADIINTTGTAFLGLTLGCARCHNHKFDPVTQTDYYSLQAVFAGVNHADRGLPLSAEATGQLAKLDREIAELQGALAKFPGRPGSDTRNGKGLRPAVNAKLNVETFASVSARFVRFTIHGTRGSNACIDELEIFSGKTNVALASSGAKPTSNGDFVHPLHRLSQVNDGEYGNARSWISGKKSGGWVQIEFPAARHIDRIVWARDRNGRYRDRIATNYEISTSLDGKEWRTIASSADREPVKKSKKSEPQYNFAGLPDQIAAKGKQQLEQLNSLTERRKQLAKPTMVYAGTFKQPGVTHRLYRGEPGSPREEVVPAAIQSLSDLTLAKNSPEKERRVAIANWIASQNNPLFARVMVNRIWQFHFGTGIVDTPSDFGANGTSPSHPELLDWLAAEFIASNWSIKHIHQLILNSRTWQQDSRPRSDGIAADAGSRLLWRFPPRRLEAEGIRDCILAVSGKIDLRMGGPGFSAFEVQPENVRHYFPKKNYGADDWRRMIYMTRVRQERDSVFGVFDCPDFNQVVPKRSRSTTPLQALNLQNSRFVLQQAEFLVERLNREAASPDQKIERAYELCFGRPPLPEETTAAVEFADQTSWLQFARAMLNANEFVFIP